MNKKNILLISLIVIFTSNIYAQTVEFLLKSKEAHFESHGPYEAYNGISVDEINENLFVHNGRRNGAYIINYNDKTVVYDETVPLTGGDIAVKLKNYLISFLDDAVFIKTTDEVRIADIIRKLGSGISFILKKGSGYIVYYVDSNGVPGAVDTEGKIYSNKEAVEYLKEYDGKKYEESRKRAEELGLSNLFEKAQVLVWGNTYYSTQPIYKQFYGKVTEEIIAGPYIQKGLIQYDQNGGGYQMRFYYKNLDSSLCRVNPDGSCNPLTSVKKYSTILSTYETGENQKFFYSSWYVGFGGNIYYYIAGEEYTEVFRIRRTWGEPDFYAMAINGYTDDEYGKYVDEVLPKLSKADLRLLRNTIFALYGVHFKSEDLSKHFDKQVWYNDEGKTSGEIELPEHRQKLVDMIQKLEK